MNKQIRGTKMMALPSKKDRAGRKESKQKHKNKFKLGQKYEKQTY